MINTDQQPKSMDGLQASLLRLNKIGISSTPTATLELMLDNLESDMNDLAAQAFELEAEAQDKFEQGDLGVYKRVRERSRLLASEMGELEGLRDRVVDAIEYNYMTDRLSKVLGGKWAVNFLQIFMMLLIFFVLGLLAYDSLAPTKCGGILSSLMIISIWCLIMLIKPRPGRMSLSVLRFRIRSMKNLRSINVLPG